MHLMTSTKMVGVLFFGDNMENLTIFYFLDAMSESGCPLCSISRKRVDKMIDNFLYESVNNGDIRIHLRENFGFCCQHAWTVKKAGSNMSQGIIYQDLTETLLNELKKSHYSPKALLKMEKRFKNRDCLICENVREIENRFLVELSKNFANPEVVTAYQNSEGLCIPHIISAIKIWKKKDSLKTFLDIELQRLENLNAELKEFIRKFDYRFKDEEFGKEKDSWIRAIKKFSGKDDSDF